MLHNVIPSFSQQSSLNSIAPLIVGGPSISVSTAPTSTIVVPSSYHHSSNPPTTTVVSSARIIQSSSVDTATMNKGLRVDTSSNPNTTRVRPTCNGTRHKPTHFQWSSAHIAKAHSTPLLHSWDYATPKRPYVPEATVISRAELHARLAALNVDDTDSPRESDSPQTDSPINESDCEAVSPPLAGGNRSRSRNLSMPISNRQIATINTSSSASLSLPNTSSYLQLNNTTSTIGVLKTSTSTLVQSSSNTALLSGNNSPLLPPPSRRSSPIPTQRQLTGYGSTVSNPPQSQSQQQNNFVFVFNNNNNANNNKDNTLFTHPNRMNGNYSSGPKYNSAIVNSNSKDGLSSYRKNDQVILPPLQIQPNNNNITNTNNLGTPEKNTLNYSPPQSVQKRSAGHGIFSALQRLIR